MKNKTLCKLMLGLLLLVSPYAFSQNVSLSSNGTAPNPSAVLDLSHCTNGGFLLPCMTTAQLTAQLPNGGAYPNSMLVFCTDDNCFWSYYTGSNTWNNEYCLCSGAPAAPGAITGTAAVTNGSIYTYSVTAVAGATTYNWTVPTGATIETGSGTNSVTVLMACTAGNVGVSAGNSCGTSTVTTKAITISSTTPVAPSTPTGSATICASSTGNVYTITPVTGATSYTWSVPGAVGTIVGVATNNTITVTAAGSAGTGNITVQTNFACGSASTASAGLAVETQTTLSAPVVTGTTPITINSTNNTYSVPAITATNINSYAWSPSSASLGTITAGATTNACSLTAASSASTTYSMQISENNACGTATTTYPVTVTTCSDNIVIDGSAVTSGTATNTLSITTGGTNELVVVACEGYSSAFTGSVAVTGGWTGAATFYGKIYDNHYAAVALYWFVAPTAATYHITVTETGFTYYDNFAVALKGFCGTPSAANFVNSNTYIGTYASNMNYLPCSGTGATTTLSLTENANSYVLGFGSAYFNSTASVPTWNSDTWAGGSTDAENDYADFGIAITTAATGNYEATFGHSIWYGALYLINIQ